EIGVIEQRLAQRRGVVEALGRRRAGGGEERVDRAWGEKPRLAEGQRLGVAQRVPEALHDDTGGMRQQLGPGYRLPQRLELREASLRRVAGEDRGVDRADRDAAQPVRLEAVLVQRLIDADVIRPERPAALQHEHAGGLLSASSFLLHGPAPMKTL